jgi:hypothetical protein
MLLTESELIKATVRAGKLSGIALIRTLCLTCLSILITVFALIGRPLRLLAHLGVVVVLITVLLEYLDHWRHMQLLFTSLGALAFVTVLLACYERLLATANGIYSKLRGYRT